ncbi:MAG TPA: SDR family NAD(P)-dependent oxidoreductase [Mycobacteriales bacterium]|nr:SDR family NAD(P)-dependent oxidoreductase [Mycobacteriales bacterium]
MGSGVAVVTGASSGIGAATARRLVAEGFEVIAAARRMDRLQQLAAETGCTPIALDVTDTGSVDELAAAITSCRVLVNNAGGAFGLDPVSKANDADWQRMYDVNVLGTMRMTRALLPALVASGDGVVVNLTSTAAHGVYEGGAGYTAAKHAQRAVSETLRLELFGQPVRVTEIAPGLVQTEEFSLMRFGGDAERAKAVYAGVPGPLTADDIADCIAWVVTRPWHVNIDSMIVRPRAQAAQHKVFREDPVDEDPVNEGPA